MDVDVKPMQHLLLWRLAAGGGEDFFANLPAGNPERSPLVRAGLIAETKRVNPAGKSKRPVLFLSLTEKGWAWCQEHMTWPRTRSIKVDTVLERLLPRLGVVCRRGAAITSLGDFISKSNETGDAPSRPDVCQAIRDACRALGNGQEGVRVRLVDLRQRLPAFNHDEVSQGLWNLCRRGELSLYRLDDPREIQPGDHEAAVLTSTGEEKHILYFGGMAS
jgi:hypothetical protein